MDISDIRRKNLAVFIKKHGLAVAAKRFGKPTRQINDIVMGRKSFGEKVARSMEKNYAPHAATGWLDCYSLIDPDNDVSLQLPRPYEESEQGNLVTLNYDTTKRDIPLISWDKINEWYCGTILDYCSHVTNWLSCPTMHSDKTFALRVNGHSMFNPDPTAQHSFKDGEIIYADPDKTPSNNSFVIVKSSNYDIPIFKQLFIDGKSKYLRSINPEWPEKITKLNDSDLIYGTVIYKGTEI